MTAMELFQFLATKSTEAEVLISNEVTGHYETISINYDEATNTVLIHAEEGRVDL